MNPDYGASGHYRGQVGRDYFATQNRFAELGARVNAKKFRAIVGPDDSVLDFGCGGGWLLRELPGKIKVGVEVNPAAHAVCRENGIDVYSSVEAVPGAGFTRIISHHCLEHVPFPIQALRELRGKLVPGGKIALIVPIDDWRVQRDATARDFDHHLHTWTPRLMANTLAEAGWSPDRVEVHAHAWPRLWHVLLESVPEPLFDLSCRAWAVLRRRRELRVVATPTSANGNAGPR